MHLIKSHHNDSMTSFNSNSGIESIYLWLDNTLRRNGYSFNQFGQFRKIIIRYKRIGYNLNVMRQSACLGFNPIRVNNYASLFYCMPVGRASDSIMAPT